MFINVNRTSLSSFHCGIAWTTTLPAFFKTVSFSHCIQFVTVVKLGTDCDFVLSGFSIQFANEKLSFFVVCFNVWDSEKKF